MNQQSHISIYKTGYDRASCKIGIVHLGFGAFHRAHQAVYVDDYMEKTGDLDWGIAAVNLRHDDIEEFNKHRENNQAYLLKTTAPNGEAGFREVRSHIHFADWAKTPDIAEALVSLSSVKIISMTVTESGYYTDDTGALDPENPIIATELQKETRQSVYAYLASALEQRMESLNEPITILCCDNIRGNGEKLSHNFRAYLDLAGEHELAKWVSENASFPNSMVDRITPRHTSKLSQEIEIISPLHAATAVQSERFIQWVLQNDFAADFPHLEKSGVEIVDTVDPYEEAKIRILNGGHTALCYLGALAGHKTFDKAIQDQNLREHFDRFEIENVLPGLSIELPFDKAEYLQNVTERFCNAAIADELGRICMDGWTKFSVFIRPTLEGCLSQGISPKWTYESIASWVIFTRRFAVGDTHIDYVDPYWNQLKALLAKGNEEHFATSESLWSDLPIRFEEFGTELVSAIKRLEEQWQV